MRGKNIVGFPWHLIFPWQQKPLPYGPQPYTESPHEKRLRMQAEIDEKLDAAAREMAVGKHADRLAVLEKRVVWLEHCLRQNGSALLDVRVIAKEAEMLARRNR